MKKWTWNVCIGLAFISLAGCGTLGAAISNQEICPYHGVQLDLMAATDWNTIQSTFGAIIPLAIVDLPFSFVLDTVYLSEVKDDNNCTSPWK